MAQEPGIYIGPNGDAYSGPGIEPGQPFDGSAPQNHNADGTKNYTHIGPDGSVLRAPGVPGDRWLEENSR